MFFYFLKTTLLVAILAVLAKALVDFMLYLDLNKRVYNHVPGQCSAIGGVEHGASDIQILDNGHAIFTTGLRLYNTSETDEAIGRLYLYNITGKSAWEMVMDSKTLKGKTFNPHGLSLWDTKKKDNVIFFVVNHRKKADTIEQFKLIETARDKIAKHLKTFKSPLFESVHDVVATSGDKFYVTNYHYFKSETWQNVELYMGLRLGNIVYFDGKKARQVASGIGAPSGLAIDKGGRYMYVSALTEEKIHIYKIVTNGDLQYSSSINLFTSPANLFVDPFTADLFATVHPIKSRLFRHQGQPKTIFAPTEILRIRGRPSKGVWNITSVYANDGATVSGGSSVAKHRNNILIGTFHDKLLACELANPTLI